MKSRQCFLTVLSVVVAKSNAFTVFPASVNRRTSSSTSSSPLYSMTVALTREEGKNDKLKQQLIDALGDMDVRLEELPCIAHKDGDDLHRLEETLNNSDWDYVVVTSPQAARVLATVWDSRDAKIPSVAVVGKATQVALESFGIPVDFCPSRALAKTLVAELPAIRENGPTTCLYPASAKAATVVQDGLTDRGFDVTRLDTYDTTTATWTEEQKQLSSTVTIACFGSPSGVKGWLHNTANNNSSGSDVLAACIGETSAKACRKLNFPESNIFYPEKPGIPGWAQAVKDALESIPVTQKN